MPTPAPKTSFQCNGTLSKFHILVAPYNAFTLKLTRWQLVTIPLYLGPFDLWAKVYVNGR